MTPEEFIAEAKRRGKSKEETFAKYEQLMAVGAFAKPRYESVDDYDLDPTAGMSGFDQLRAGFGKAIYDTARGVGNLVGLVDSEDIQEANRRDSALMDKPLGMTGNVLGHASQFALPGGLVAGAGKVAGSAKAVSAGKAMMAPTTYKGAAGAGALYGGIQSGDSGSAGDRLLGAGLGAAGGGLGVLAGRMLQGTGQGGVSLFEPVTEGGRDKIVSRYLSDQIIDPEKAAKSLQNPVVYVPGSMPTAAEASMDAGIAQMTRAARNADPLFNAKLTQLESAQNVARIDFLDGLKGESLDAARNVMAKSATKRFKDVPIDTSPLKKLTEGMATQSGTRFDDSAAKSLTHIRQKLDGVEDLADLYELRKTLTTDKLSKMDGFDAKTLIIVRDAIDDVAAKQSPLYKQYLDDYAAMSIPGNQNTVIDELSKRSTQAIQNPPELVMQGAAEVQLSPAKFANQVKNDRNLVKAATGFKKAAGLQGTMTADQFAGINAINTDLARSSRAATLGKAVGSNTAQNLASQNIANRALGGILPSNLVDLAANGLPGRAANVIYGGANEKIGHAINEALLDPERLRQLILMSNQGRLAPFAKDGMGIFGASVGVGAPVGLLGQ